MPRLPRLRDSVSEKFIIAYREVLRRVVVLVQVDPNPIVVGQFGRFAQFFDELLHVLHGLFVGFATDLLQVQRNEGRPPTRHIAEEFLDPNVEQTGRLFR